MKSIGVVTVARSDYGIYLPVLRRIQQDPELELRLIVGGMHLEPAFGETINAIVGDGFEPRARVSMQLSGGEPRDIAGSMGRGVHGFADYFSEERPDMLMVLGDRFDMFSAVVAALPFHIPVAHLHGGESTEALIDEAIRHAMTKMSHVHFASTETYAQRIIQMGEEPWRVMVSGAPSLDHLRSLQLVERGVLSRRVGLDLIVPPLVVTFHPVTLAYEDTRHHVRELLAALDALHEPVVFTYPNADTYGRIIIEEIERFVDTRSWATACVNLGTQGYFSLMHYAAAMVGNSSSGIIEAASFALPVVNIGDRQRGRIHAENVLDAACERAAITKTVQRAVAPQFRDRLRGLVNPYGDGYASTRIVNRLKEIPLDTSLIMKRWHPAVPQSMVGVVS
jgi:UDP-hydrolysing UDP-N-acetyl-D-glucosamine 2-epimerase